MRAAWPLLLSTLSAGSVASPGSNSLLVLRDHGPCRGRLNIAFLPSRPHLCRSVDAANCELFFIRLGAGGARPCIQGPRGVCMAGAHEECARPPPTVSPSMARQWRDQHPAVAAAAAARQHVVLAGASSQAAHALRRQRRMQRRSYLGRLGEPCTSTMPPATDVRHADCEGWCGPANGTVPDSCKYCKWCGRIRCAWHIRGAACIGASKATPAYHAQQRS